jgi:hypothetical protein
MSASRQQLIAAQQSTGFSRTQPTSQAPRQLTESVSPAGISWPVTEATSGSSRGTDPCAYTAVLDRPPQRQATSQQKHTNMLLLTRRAQTTYTLCRPYTHKHQGPCGQEPLFAARPTALQCQPPVTANKARQTIQSSVHHLATTAHTHAWQQTACHPPQTNTYPPQLPAPSIEKNTL